MVSPRTAEPVLPVPSVRQAELRFAETLDISSLHALHEIVNLEVSAAPNGSDETARKTAITISVLFGQCGKKNIEGPSVPGRSIIHQGHLFSKKGHLW